MPVNTAERSASGIRPPRVGRPFGQPYRLGEPWYFRAAGPEPGEVAEQVGELGDGTEFAGALEQHTEQLGRTRVATGEHGTQVAGEPFRRGLVQDQPGREPYSGREGEPVAQLYGGERVHAEFEEAPPHVDRLRTGVSEHRGDLGAHPIGN